MKRVALLQWLGLLLLSISLKSVAQPENLYFEHLSPNPLPHTLVWSIYQDEEGFMWFGTYSGLVKYDGATTTIWETNATDTDHVLRSSRIHDMHDDQQGNLWFPTEGGGLHQLNKRTGKVRVYPIDSLQATRWDVALSIFEDGQGMFWLSCGLGMARFDPATHEYSLHPSPDEQAIDFLQQDAQGRFWGVNQEGLWQFDPTTGKYTLLPLLSPNGNKLGANSLHLGDQGVAWIGTFREGVFQVNVGQKSQEATPCYPGLVNKNIKRNGIYGANGYLWLATNQGLQCIDTKTNQIASYTSDPSLPGSLSNDNLILIYKDRMDNLWIGMFPGVNKVSLQAYPFYMHQIIPTPEPFRRDENVITSILEDHTGTVWVVSAANGLYRFNPLTHQLTHMVVNSRDANKELSNLYGTWTLYEDREGRLWVGGGTDKGLYLYNREKGIFTRYDCEMAVASLDMDAAGKLWISGRPESMASFDPLTGQFTYYQLNEKNATDLLPGNNNDLLVSRTGEIWVSSTRGLSRLDPKTGSFTHHHPPYRTGDEYFNDLTDLYQDTQGILWVGSRQGGLNRFDPSTGSFTQFTTRDGLPGNRVNNIVGDAQGNLWIGTDNGLSRFTPVTRTFRNFDTSDGLPTIPYFTGQSAHSRQGRLLFGTYNGFVIFHPDSIKDQKSAPPPVYITGFKVLEKSLPVPDTLIELPYDENFLSFEFVAINYDAYEKNQYVYQLEGVDQDWVYSGTRRFASYPNLDPRKYIFRVKATNGEGIWNEQEASIQIVILPPWWETWWAYTLYGLLALGILRTIHHYELKRLRLRHRAAYLAELDTMKSHFFANISHEFRTPLTLILGPVKQLMDKYTDQQDQNNLSGIQRNAQRLLHLVNQLLDLSKLEAGKLKLEAVKSDIVAFLKARAYAFSSLADHKNIHFAIELPEEKIGAYFDHDKLEKIINNLLSNAFKFTAEGGFIKFHAQPITKDHKSWFQIQVVDSGIGIPLEKINRIFDRFYQVDNSPTREQEGTGIGLALTKELVELHQGEIKVESTLGQGTYFTLLLPLGKEHLKEEEIIQELPFEAFNDQTTTHPSAVLIDKADSPLEKENTEKETGKPLVLIVEDNEEVRKFIAQSIHSSFQVQEAAHGIMGLEMAIALLPDLIISDVMMPEMDGFQLCEKIKTDELTSHIPVILLTARADRQSKLAGLEIGADDYLAKPFDAEELLLIARNRIEERRKMRERFSRDITLEPQQISITSLDEQFLTKVLDTIEEHMDDENFTIEALSEEAGFSHMHFYRKIKALTDQTPSQFLRTVRLKRAAALLQKKSDHVTQIAYSVGFGNVSYFNKCFKDQFGMTPTQFAAQVQPQK